MQILRHLPLLAGLVLAGCTTTPPTLSNTPPPSTNPFTELHSGQTATQIKALLGEPGKIMPFKPKSTQAGGITSEVWTYRRKIAGTTGQVAVGTKDVPFYDPFTGITKMLKEPVYHTETVSVIEVAELLMIQQELIEWKSHRETERVID
jgi:hypothetical protein